MQSWTAFYFFLGSTLGSPVIKCTQQTQQVSSLQTLHSYMYNMSRIYWCVGRNIKNTKKLSVRNLTTIFSHNTSCLISYVN